jgi:hypothetical protein
MPPALSFAEHLFSRRARRRQRQINPDSRPDFAVGDALPRIVAAAAQGGRRMRRFRHVAERPDADAALHIGEQSRTAGSARGQPSAPRCRGGCRSAAGDAGNPPCPPPCRASGAACAATADSDASFNVAAGPICAGASAWSWRYRAPTGNSPHWPAPSTRQCSLTASSVTFNQAQTGLAGNESLHPFVGFEQQGTVLVHAARNAVQGHCPRARPAPAGRSVHRALSRRPRKRGEAFTLELRQHTQKLVQDGSPPPNCVRRHATGVRTAATAPRRPQPRRPRSRGETRPSGRHVEAHSDHHMRRPAGLGPQLDQHPADLAILKPDVVGPLERNVPWRRLRLPARATPPPPPPDSKPPKYSPRRGRSKPPTAPHRRRRVQSSAARAGRGPRAATRSSTHPRCPAAARCTATAGYWWNPLRTELEAAQLLQAPHIHLGADAPSVQQFHGIRQAVTARASASTGSPRRAGVPRPSTQPRGSPRVACASHSPERSPPSASSTSSLGEVRLAPRV